MTSNHNLISFFIENLFCIEKYPVININILTPILPKENNIIPIYLFILLISRLYKELYLLLLCSLLLCYSC